MDRWTEENPNPNAFYPRLSTNEVETTNYASSTWWVKRADYLRLKQAEVGYNFTSKQILGKNKKNDYFQKLRLYMSGTNLLTFSRWKFWDPELGDGRGTSYPNISTYNVGMRITF